MKLIILILLFNFFYAHKIDNVPITLVQPDESIINCFASGDQYYQWVHDMNGYSIIQNERDGFYYYATKVNGQIVPSEYVVDAINPERVGLDKNIIIDRQVYLDKRNAYWDNIERRDAPSIGTINNINVFIRFSDEIEFPNSRTFYDIPFNEQDGPSLNHYFKEVSYNLLTVNTIHFPICEPDINISYQDEHPRSYYQPYNEITNPNGYQNDSQSRIREHDLLRSAIEYIASEVPEDLDVDANNDGYVDNVTFLVRGSPGAWASLLWPHRWVLYTHSVYLNGARVYDYNLNMEQGGYFTVGTLSHEFFHSLGAPDLYHYWDDVAPVAVGGWDVMDQSSDIPQSMSAYMKYRYTDWITELPVLNYGGTYELSPLSNPENNIFRVNSPSSENEYFVLEYRVKEGLYEVNTPGGDNGLVIYRVDDNLTGNANGPPDELYVYRTNGTPNSNGTFSGAVFNEQSGRNKFNDNTNPSCFLYDGSPGGINISNIGSPNDVIRFDIVNMILLPEINGVSFDSDNDGIINPGEEVIIDISISNLSNLNAENVSAFIEFDNENIELFNSEINYGNIQNNNIIQESLILNLNENAFGIIPFDINVIAEYTENGQNLIYEDSFDLEIDVSLNQTNFPYFTSNEIHSSPVVGDVDINGEKEIIFGDHFGLVRAVNFQGEEVLDNIFPYDTGNQIWGSPALSDIDLDGLNDIIVVSKSKDVFVFDLNGLKWSYSSNSQLIGTPSIGNVVGDEKLEIILSGYSNNENNFIILSNEGNDLTQLFINEKNKSGFALNDFNDNGLSDIVFGTDNNNLYLIYDNQEIANGFPFQSNDKFRLSPIILEYGNNKIIIAACDNKFLYAIDSQGDIHFSLELEHSISTAPSILNYQNQPHIFFGLGNGDIYAVDFYGNVIYSYNINSGIVGSIVFGDLNSDNYPEIIVANDIGYVYVLNLDGSVYNNFPIQYDFPFSSSPIIEDIDNDDDYEIIIGTTNSLFVLDIKSSGEIENYWHMYGENNNRTNYFSIDLECNLGDIDFNGLVNVLDVVMLANIVLTPDENYEELECAYDLNYDSQATVQDIILLVDYIFESN